MKLKTRKKIFTVFVILLFWFMPIAFVDAITISDAKVSGITDKSVLIDWKTDIESDSVINYGNEIPPAYSVTDSESKKQHSLLISGLEKDATYYYDISSTSGTETETDNNNGLYYQFHTSGTDLTPPIITVELPLFIQKNEVDIIGKTEINTIVEVYVNNILVKKQLFPDGNIIYPGVDLTANINNNLLIKAIDFAGNVNEKRFSVFSDFIAPSIKLTKKINDVVKEAKLDIKGTVSELALVSIIVNNNPIFSNKTTSFSVQANLNNGNNTIKITAADNAGRTDLITKSVILDTTPPKIENLKPSENSFYYEGKAKDDITGTTEPFSTVELYYQAENVIGDMKKVKIGKTTADKNGFFKFNDINLESPEILIEDPTQHTGIGIKGSLTLTELEPGERIGDIAEKQKAVKITLFIKSTDRAGFETEQSVNYLVGTCWGGEMTFDVNLFPEYQRPSMLSPERLKEGTEIISFILNFTYAGEADKKEDWKIIGINVDKACGRSAGQLAAHFEKDHRYNISCKILQSRPDVKDHNNDKTLWFIEYKRLRTEGYTDFMEDFWKEITDREMIFPLKLTIKYKEKEYNKQTGKMEWSELKYQTKCISVSYVVDIPVDFRKVLPDWLLEGGIELANKTIEKLDEWIPKLENVIDITSMSCIASFISRLAVKIYRKITCKLDTYKGQLKDDDDSKCPSKNKRLELPIKELEEKCSSCANAWKAEAAVYQAYRWTCDRIFCHPAPAAWTETATPPELLKAELKSRTCAGEELAGVNPLIEKENCYKEFKDVLKTDYIKARIETCYQHGNDLYVYLDKPPENEVYILHKATVPKGRIGQTTGPDTIQVIKQEGSNTYATAVNFNCNDLCKIYGKDLIGECISESQCRLAVDSEKQGFLAGYTKDCWVNQDAINGKKQCCCHLKNPTEKEKDEKRIGSPSDWNYRDQQLYREYKGKKGKYFSEKIYTPGRDRSSCFGQNYLLDYGGEKSVPMIDPNKQEISTFQCLCLTAIRARLLLLKSIMSGFANCFHQIKTTGEADAGICKEMFTQYVCDLIYQVIIWIKNGCIPLPFGAGEVKFSGQRIGVDGDTSSSLFAEGFKITFGSIWETIGTAGDDLESEYGESQLTNFLSGGEKAISKKICLAAFGIDVGLDMDSIMDMTYNVQTKTTIGAYGSRRDFLTYNPSNGLATYEYRTSWAIFPGCDIKDYQVDLVCVNLEENSEYNGIDCSAVGDAQSGDAPKGCNCLYSEQPYQARSRPFYRSRDEIKSGIFSEGDEHKVFEDKMRFDHIRFKLNLKKGFDKNKCFPDGHEDGIFYFPITDKTAVDLLDCFIDQRGLFRCTRGIEWEAKGEAWFEDFSIEQCKSGKSCTMLCKDPIDRQYKDCSIVSYEKENTIKAKVKVSGKKKQCIYLYAADAKGEKINSRNIIPISMDNSISEEYSEREIILPLGYVSSKSFEKGDYTVKIAESDEFCTKYSRINAKDSTSKSAGAVEIEFRNEDEKFRIKTTARVINESNQEINKDSIYTEDKVKKMIFYINGFAVKFPEVEFGKCNFETSRITGKQMWKLHAELRYPDSDMQCDANAVEKIGVIGQETEINKMVDVYEKRPKLASLEINILKNKKQVSSVTEGDKFIIQVAGKDIVEKTSVVLKIEKPDKTITLGTYDKSSFDYEYTEYLPKADYKFIAETIIEGQKITGEKELTVVGKAKITKQSETAKAPKINATQFICGNGIFEKNEVCEFVDGTSANIIQTGKIKIREEFTLKQEDSQINVYRTGTENYIDHESITEFCEEYAGTDCSESESRFTTNKAVCSDNCKKYKTIIICNDNDWLPLTDNGESAWYWPVFSYGPADKKIYISYRVSPEYISSNKDYGTNDCYEAGDGKFKSWSYSWKKS